MPVVLHISSQGWGPEIDEPVTCPARPTHIAGLGATVKSWKDVAATREASGSRHLLSSTGIPRKILVARALAKHAEKEVELRAKEDKNPSYVDTRPGYALAVVLLHVSRLMEILDLQRERLS